MVSDSFDDDMDTEDFFFLFKVPDTDTIDFFRRFPRLWPRG
jgi:hypothetical protein